MSKPKSMQRAKSWTDEVEEAYRFQLAGYRDAIEYLDVNKGSVIDRWHDNNYVKKLRRKDGYFYYYDRTRECADKDLNKVKLYLY